MLTLFVLFYFVGFNDAIDTNTGSFKRHLWKENLPCIIKKNMKHPQVNKKDFQTMLWKKTKITKNIK